MYCPDIAVRSGLANPSSLAFLDEGQLLPLGDLLVPNEFRVHALLRHVLRLLHPLDAVSVGFVAAKQQQIGLAKAMAWMERQEQLKQGMPGSILLVLVGVILGLGHFEGSLTTAVQLSTQSCVY